MKLLLKAALRNKKHFFLALFSFLTLFIMPIANQTEIFSLGLMANTGQTFLLFLIKEKQILSLLKMFNIDGKK